MTNSFAGLTCGCSTLEDGVYGVPGLYITLADIYQFVDVSGLTTRELLKTPEPAVSDSTPALKMTSIS